MATSLYKFQVAVRLCEDHDKKEIHAYCKTCEKKICSSCIKEDHTSHDWETITDILRERKRTLPGECEDIRSKQLPDLKKELNRFYRKVEEENIRLNKIETKLNDSRQSYINKINQLFDDRIDECQRKSKSTIQKYAETCIALEMKVIYLENMSIALGEDINTLPDHDILDMEKEMRDELEKALSYRADKYTCTSVFVPGQMDVETLENMMGEIHNVSLEEIYDIDRYTDTINSLIPISDTKAWVVSGDDEYAILLNSTGEQSTTKTIPCYDLKMFNNEEIVVSSFEKRIISVLTKDEETIRTIDTKPLYPTWISKTKNDDILVTMVDGGDEYNLTPNSRRIVQRMTLTGKVFHTYEFREDGKTRLFTYPASTAENKNKDICIVNWLGDDSGELVVLNKDGRIKFTYSDGLEIEKIQPGDIHCDDKCRILFTEGNSRSIHMLSSEGKYLCTLCQYEQLRPWVISIHGDNLWCGFYDGRIKVLKYSNVK